MRVRRRSILPRPLLIILAAALFSCGGGGGGGGGGGTPTSPTPPPAQASTVFVPAGNGTPNSLSLRQSQSSTSTNLVLELVATSVEDLYGMAFELTLPSVVSFGTASEGTFLSADGSGTSIQSAIRGNVVIVGITRLGDTGGASGDGVVLSLDLRPVVAGSGTLSFSRNRALRPDGTEVPGLTWTSGSVQVTG